MKHEEKTISEVTKNLSMNEYVIVDKKSKLVVIYDSKAADHGEQKILRLYNLVEGDKVEQFPFETALDRITGLIIDKVDKEVLLKEVLKTTPPDDLVKIIKRLEKPGLAEKVTPGPGCYSLKIPGTKGQKPIELVLVS